MNKMKAWQGSYGISDYTGIVSPAYFIFDMSFDNLEYFHYAIRSKVYVNFFAQASDGIRVGQWDLQMDKMKEIPFIVPPADEQTAIVDYINCMLPQYDVAIEKLIVEVETLEEYKTKLIADVVTGKIDVRNVKIPEYEFVDEDVDSDLEGENDLDDIVAYITQKLFNPSAAGELLDGVEACYENLRRTPYMYGECSDIKLRAEGYPRAVIGSYVLVYKIDEVSKNVLIMRYFYGARDYMRLL